MQRQALPPPDPISWGAERADLTGPGKFFIQTRSQDQFLSWLIPKLPKAPSSSSDT
jgi:hypothetical protein